MSISEWVIYFWNLRFLPLRVRWPMLKWRRRILHPRSPLELRDSCYRARSLRHPPQTSSLLFLARLLWPFPSWRFPALLPGTVDEVRQQCDKLVLQSADLVQLRCMPLWRWRDTPQRSLYRMYEAVIVDAWPMLQYEVEYFWRHGDRAWATANLHDPALDSRVPLDPVQYTIMAAIVEQLVDSFEWRLALGLRRLDPASSVDQETVPLVPESMPSWPATVPALPDMLGLQACDDDDAEANELEKGNRFLNRNVLVFAGEFYTV